MSLCGPIMSWIFSMNLRVSRSSSPRDSLVGIAVDPPLGAAERQIDERRLPGHQAGQRPGLVLVDRGVIAQPPLERPARIVVLHPVADEVADLSRIQLDHDFHPHLSVGRDHQRAHVFRQVETVRRLLEIMSSSPRRLASLGRSLHKLDSWMCGPARSDRTRIVTDHPATRNGTRPDRTRSARVLFPDWTRRDATMAARRNQLRLRQVEPAVRGRRTAARARPSRTTFISLTAPTPSRSRRSPKRACSFAHRQGARVLLLPAFAVRHPDQPDEVSPGDELEPQHRRSGDRRPGRLARGPRRSSAACF